MCKALTTLHRSSCQMTASLCWTPIVISTHRLCREVVPRVAWSEGVQQVAGFHASKGPRLRRLVPSARLRSYWITFLLKISISRYRYISSSGSFLFHIRKYVDQDSYHHYTKSHSVTFTYFCQKYQTMHCVLSKEN